MLKRSKETAESLKRISRNSSAQNAGKFEDRLKSQCQLDIQAFGIELGNQGLDINELLSYSELLDVLSIS